MPADLRQMTIPPITSATAAFAAADDDDAERKRQVADLVAEIEAWEGVSGA